MNKLIIIFLLSPLVTVAQVKPDTTKKPEKPLTVTLSLQEWQTILYVIKQSNAPYPVVTKVQEEMLLPQLQRQIDEQNKKK